MKTGSVFRNGQSDAPQNVPITIRRRRAGSYTHRRALRRRPAASARSGGARWRRPIRTRSGRACRLASGSPPYRASKPHLRPHRGDAAIGPGASVRRDRGWLRRQQTPRRRQDDRAAPMRERGEAARAGRLGSHKPARRRQRSIGSTGGHGGRRLAEPCASRLRTMPRPRSHRGARGRRAAPRRSRRAPAARWRREGRPAAAIAPARWPRDDQGRVRKTSPHRLASRASPAARRRDGVLAASA